MKLAFASVFLALLSSAAAAAPDVSPAQPVIPAAQFNLSDYGADGDGVTPNTEAFKRAVAAVDHAGGGTLIVPAGTYFTGPFDLCSSLNLKLAAGATIQFSPDFALYRDPARPKGFRPMMLIADAHDVLISGSGAINGHGEAWWPEARRFKDEANRRHASSNTSPRPIMVDFSKCQRVRVEGITLTNSAVFNLVQNACSDVTVDGITIFNPENSPNTDGIDPKACQRVLIQHCKIDTGDDCIALGGSGEPGERDVLVTDCTFRHGHGCSIGSGTAGGVSNVLVRRCTFDGTVTGVRLKSARGRGGLTENVVYEDLQMRNVGTAISISSYYDVSSIDKGGSATIAAAPVTERTPIWRNIVVRNVTATDVTRNAGLIAGLPEAPARDILLENVNIRGGKSGLHVAYAQSVELKNVRFSPDRGPDVIADATVQDLTRVP